MQALKLLKAGQQELRVHANCGTNLVATALLTTLATMVGMLGSGQGGRGYKPSVDGRRGSGAPWQAFLKRLERFPRAVLFSTLAIFLARPFGVWLQLRVTTADDLENTEIAAILTDYHLGLQRIRVRLRHRKGVEAAVARKL
jgi:hypothetical protein